MATWEDVAQALGRPLSEVGAEEQAQIEHWLTGVELLITARLGSVASLDQSAVRYVEAEAVAQKRRRFGDPSGMTSVTVTADDGSVTRRYEQSPITMSDITDEWWRLLRPSPRQRSVRLVAYGQDGSR